MTFKHNILTFRFEIYFIVLIFSLDIKFVITMIKYHSVITWEGFPQRFVWETNKSPVIMNNRNIIWLIWLEVTCSHSLRFWSLSMREFVQLCTPSFPFLRKGASTKLQVLKYSRILLRLFYGPAWYSHKLLFTFLQCAFPTWRQHWIIYVIRTTCNIKVSWTRTARHSDWR